MSLTSRYLGSSSLQTSIAMQELAPEKPSHFTVPYHIRKLSFRNDEHDCTVILNGETEIFLKAGDGFEIGYDDPPITSFKIKESGVNFRFIGTL